MLRFPPWADLSDRDRVAMLAPMQFHREARPDILMIRSYREGALRVNDAEYTGSLILSTTAIMPDWGARSTDALNLDLLAPALALDPQILLLGTGELQRFPEPRISAEIMAMGIGLEVMNTAAACRTYNILASEDRKVVAALIL
jgi:uncharacterized protein